MSDELARQVVEAQAEIARLSNALAAAPDGAGAALLAVARAVLDWDRARVTYDQAFLSAGDHTAERRAFHDAEWRLKQAADALRAAGWEGLCVLAEDPPYCVLCGGECEGDHLDEEGEGQDA